MSHLSIGATYISPGIVISPTIDTMAIQGDYFHLVKEIIILHESTRHKAYLDVKDISTIGNGHVITNDAHLLNIELSDFQIDSLLVSDINKSIRYVNANITKSIDRHSRKYWFMVHFVYCKGIGNFNKSKLKIALLKNAPIKIIENELAGWCYYTSKSGVKKYSHWSAMIRKSELAFLKTGSFK